MRRVLIVTALLMAQVLAAQGVRQSHACECTYGTEASMSATPPGACLGSGTSHTITVTARDLDGMKSIEITQGTTTLRTCTYDPPTTSW